VWGASQRLTHCNVQSHTPILYRGLQARVWVYEQDNSYFLAAVDGLHVVSRYTCLTNQRVMSVSFFCGRVLPRNRLNVSRHPNFSHFS